MKRFFLYLRNDRSLLWALVTAVVGVAGVAFGFTPYMNPPQCGDPGAGDNCIIGANIGIGFHMLFWVPIALVGVVWLSGLLLYRFSRKRKHKWLPSVVLLLILIGSYVLFVSIPNARQARLDEELVSRRDGYVAYVPIPDMAAATAVSDSARATGDGVALDVFACKPGLARISTPDGEVAVLISGIKESQFQQGPEYNDCVFYTETAPSKLTDNTAQNRKLPVKCMVSLYDPDMYENTLLVQPSSIRLEKESGSCQELSDPADPPVLTLE